jgi:adenosine deaminase
MSYTPLTQAMIDECPAIDIHVHVPGTITPETAWELGIRNQFITVKRDKVKGWVLEDGPAALNPKDPVGKYSRLFTSKGNRISFDAGGKPIDLEYNFNCVGSGTDVFTGFDAVMATVQGHRYQCGGIENEDDYRFVMDKYLESCLKQNIRYTEVLQNIFISQAIYKGLGLTEEAARAKFFRLCKEISERFEAKDVILRFHNCPNKTSQSGRPGTLEEQALDWVKWLQESDAIAPGVFVGLNSAGHEQREKDEGGPHAMQKAYTLAKQAGFGCEAHAGEGIGVEHMMDTMNELPVTRLAHGVQVIESQQAITHVKENGLVLIMMPSINVALHSPIHKLDGVPHAKLNPDGTRNIAVQTQHISSLADHPFFPLLRDHGLAIALAGDDPEMGGKSYKTQAAELAGLGTYTFPEGFKPLSAEELARCNLTAIKAAFCAPDIKMRLVKELKAWMEKYGVKAMAN